MSKKLNIVFFGTPKIATIVLSELKHAGITPTLIVTAPDAPKGRKLVFTPSPVSDWGGREDIEVLKPKTFKDNPDLDVLLNTEWDLFIVAAYGKIIPRTILDLPKHGALNVHPSLLPKFRGPSPIRSAILADERTTGVTIMQMDEKMDHGPIVAQAKIELDQKDWPPRGNMFDELMAHAGGELLAEVIPAWIGGEIEAEKQDHEKATYCKKITKEMGEIDLDDDPYQNLLKIRAFDGWPGTYFFTERDGKNIRVKITDAELTKDGALNILKVIPEGKKEIKYEDFCKS